MDEAAAMNATFDFTGVESAKGYNVTVPGTIAVFKITDAEYMTSDKKGTPGLKCTFEEPEGSQFNHTFWLTPNSFQRVQALTEAVGNQKFSGPATGAQIVAAIKGKSLPLKVVAQIDDKEGKVYPDLPFGGFSEKTVAELKLTASEKKEIVRGEALVSKSDIQHADAEDDGIATDTASDASKAEAEEF